MVKKTKEVEKQLTCSCGKWQGGRYTFTGDKTHNFDTETNAVLDWEGKHGANVKGRWVGKDYVKKGNDRVLHQPMLDGVIIET